jgi:hypothetical protein
MLVLKEDNKLIYDRGNMEMDRILKKYYALFLWCLGSHRKNIGGKLKRNGHPEQRSGSGSQKILRPNFGRDLGLIKTGVSVLVSGSRRALQKRILKMFFLAGEMESI